MRWDYEKHKLSYMCEMSYIYSFIITMSFVIAILKIMFSYESINKGSAKEIMVHSPNGILCNH